MQQNSTETLHQNRNPLKQITGLSSLASINCDSFSKISQELESWCVENSQGLNGNGLKDITGAKINIFVFFASGCQLCCWTCRRMTWPMGKWPWRPNITTCRSAKGPMRPHLIIIIVIITNTTTLTITTTTTAITTTVCLTSASLPLTAGVGWRLRLPPARLEVEVVMWHSGSSSFRLSSESSWRPSSESCTDRCCCRSCDVRKRLPHS